MKAWWTPTKLERTSYLIMMPVIAIVLNQLLFGLRQWSDIDIWLFSFPLIAVQGLGSWMLHIIVMHWLRIRFPHIRQTRLRLILLGIAHVCLITITFVSLFYAYHITGFLDYTLNTSQLGKALALGIGLTLVATTMWESDYTLTQWKASLAEKEKMEQLTIQHEFETLKSQVNPHFLFNCFNTLSSLITEDRRQAEVFLDELSKVYRYLLRNNEEGLSTLQNEVRFIESYYQLLRTRHGEAVQLKIEIDKKYDNYLLPSLSLQLLVENAVKHNVLSKNRPLMIDIFTTSGNKLVVSNNFHPRTVKGPSNKIGLDNIRSKYALLHQQGFHVLQDGKSFSVVLPLIWNRISEPSLITIDN